MFTKTTLSKDDRSFNVTDLIAPHSTYKIAVSTVNEELPGGIAGGEGDHFVLTVDTLAKGKSKHLTCNPCQVMFTYMGKKLSVAQNHVI